MLHCLGRTARVALLLALLGAGMVVLARPDGARSAPEEYALKAAYLYNFVKYVDWPEERFALPDEPYLVCVVGPDPFDVHLARAVAGKTVRNRGFVLESHASVSPELALCHVLFVSASSRLAPRVLEATASESIVTVGEGDFARAGGVASFVRTDTGFRVELNMRAARERGLRVSGRLQQVSTIVGE